MAEEICGWEKRMKRRRNCTRKVWKEAAISMQWHDNNDERISYYLRKNRIGSHPVLVPWLILVRIFPGFLPLEGLVSFY
jgi:hypothetical protein